MNTIKSMDWAFCNGTIRSTCVKKTPNLRSQSQNFAVFKHRN